MGVGWGDAGGHGGGVLRLWGDGGWAWAEADCGGLKAHLDGYLPLLSSQECRTAACGVGPEEDT